MKHIKTYESYRIKKNREEIIKESVLQVNDIYKVRTLTDIPQSLINAYVKKVKDTTGKNLRQFFGDVDIAEEIIKYITLNNVDVEKIPGNALMGGAQGQAQGQAQSGQVQVQTEAEPQAQTQAQAPQAQAQAPQAQAQAPQAQAQAPQSQAPQAQAPQAQAQGAQEFVEPVEDEEENEEGEENEEEEENELPL